MASLASLTITLSMKKLLSICPLNLFLFSIYAVKIGRKWNRILIIFADHLIQKGWWIKWQTKYR